MSDENLNVETLLMDISSMIQEIEQEITTFVPKKPNPSDNSRSEKVTDEENIKIECETVDNAENELVELTYLYHMLSIRKDWLRFLHDYNSMITKYITNSVSLVKHIQQQTHANNRYNCILIYIYMHIYYRYIYLYYY